MKNKKRLMSILLSYITLLFFFTSCNRTTADYSNIQNQEWLSQVPNTMTVTNLKGQKKDVTFGFRKNAVINALKAICLDHPLDNSKAPTADAYSVLLQYSNVEIRYTFYENELYITINDNISRIYSIESGSWNKITLQLRDINPS